MDFINKKSFCAQFLSQFPSIKLETIKTLCSNGFETYYELIGLNIDSDLSFGSDISLGQKALIRKALIHLNSHSDNGFNYQFNHSFISFNNNNNNIQSNLHNCDNVLDQEINHKKTSIAFICLDNETDDEIDYEDINPLRDQKFIHQKENNYFNNDLKQEIKSECKTSLEFGFNSELFDKQNRDSNELTINMKTERKEIKRRRKSKELIPLSLIKSRQMPDCDYYKLLKTVRMPYILINRLIIDQELRNKFIEYKNWFRTKRRNSGKKTKSKLMNDNLNNTKIKGLFKCDYIDCGYSGPNAHYLRMHKYRHTGEKHITCDWPGCQFSSIWRHSVREHYYTHTNEKPHKCGWNGCQYSSAQSGNLAKHKRIHFGDKPYLCHWLGCSQKFSNNQSLDTHLRIKHNYIPIEHSNHVIIDNNSKSSYERIEENINEFFDKEVDAQNNFEISREINLSHNKFLNENKQNSIENISHNFGNHFTPDFSFNNNLVKESVEKEKKVKKRRVSPQKLSQTYIDSMNESIDKVINDCLKEEFIDNTNAIESNDGTKLYEKDIQNTNSFKCLWPECDYNNEDSIEFEKHSRTHGPKKRRISSEKAEVMCCWPGCEYKTKYSRLLRDHQNAHNGIRHHKCNHCNYNSSYFGDIRRHMSKNHSLIFEEIKRNRKLKQMETKSKSKKSRTLSEESELSINETICGVIDKAMDETNCRFINDSNSELLSETKLEVIDESNGEVINGTNCEDINQNEQLISCLSGHQTGELKPYFCGWSGCAFSTIDSDLFVRHRREHIGGELQYHCDQQQCYYETNRFNSLIIHKRRYHRIETFQNNCQTILQNNLEPSILTIDNNSQELINGFNYDLEFKNDFFSNDEYLNYFYEQNFF